MAKEDEKKEAKRAPVVVLALDGSEPSRRALAPARQVAQALGAQLDVLYVVESPLVQGPVPEPILVGDFRGGKGWDVEASRAYLEGGWEPIPDAKIYVAFGRPAREIVCFAAGREASLIVLATRGRSGLPRAVLGSVAEECVRRSHVPVLVIPAADKRSPRRPRAKRESRVTVIGGRRLPSHP
ncbi:MAG: universal stress protein [Gemmatimonadota bacterium]